MKKLQTNNNYTRFSLSFNVLCVYLQCQTIKTKLLWKSIYVMFVVGNTTRQLVTLKTALSQVQHLKTSRRIGYDHFAE